MNFRATNLFSKREDFQKQSQSNQQTDTSFFEIKMEDLQEKFKTKVEVAKECLEFFAGDHEATLRETNSAMIEVGELKRKMQILKTVVDKLKLQTKQAEKIAGQIHERIENIEYLNENLPKAMIANGQQTSKVRQTLVCFPLIS